MSAHDIFPFASIVPVVYLDIFPVYVNFTLSAVSISTVTWSYILALSEAPNLVESVI